MTIACARPLSGFGFFCRRQAAAGRVALGALALGLLLQGAPANGAGMAPSVSPQASAARGVLILSGLQYGLPVPDTLTASAVATLKGKGVSANEIYVENLDLVRSDYPGGRTAIARLLKDKLARADIKLVIAQNQSAMDFLAGEGHDIVPPHVPALSIIADPVTQWRGTARPVLNVSDRYDVAGTIRHGLALFPRTRRLFIVVGADEDGAALKEQVARWRATLPGTLETEDTAALRYEEVLARVTALPPDTLILLGL